MIHYLKVLLLAAFFIPFSLLLNAADQHHHTVANEEKGWKILFETLLPIEKFSVQVVDNKILITGANIKSIKNQLTRAFSSNTAFYNQLNYEVLNVKKWQDTAVFSNNIAMPDDMVSAIRYIKNVFGPDMFKKIKVSESDLFDINDGARFLDGILYSSPLQDSKVCNKYVNFWMSRIAGLSAGEIRLAIRDKIEPKRNTEVFKSKEIANVCGPFQACCAVIATDRQSQIIFDVKKIHELVMPPVITEGSGGTLIIDQTHLITHLKQLTGTGMLLRIFKLDEEKYAEPIMVPKSHRSQKPSIHYVLIDRSGSMSEFYLKLTEHLGHFTEKIADNNNGSKIHLVFFADDSIKKDFTLRDKESIKCGIKDTLTKVGGTTALYDTIYDAINEIKTNQLTDTFNVTLTIFTDGRDCCSSKNETDLEQLVATIPEESRPKVFALGFGNANEDFLRKLSHTLVGPYLKLNSIDDFKFIEQHDASFKHESEVIKFLVTLATGNQMSFRVPVLKNNTPQPLKLILPITNNRIYLEQEGQGLDVVISNANQVRSGGIADKIAVLRSQSIAIVGNDDIVAAAKIRELGRILAELREINVYDREHIKLRDTAVNKIQDSITRISGGALSNNSGSLNFFDI